MKDAFRVFWGALRDFWDGLFHLMLMNVVTVLLAIPVVTFPPALAGLWCVGNQVAQGRIVDWSDYFGAFRRYFWKAWGLALLNALAAAVTFANLRFYTPGIAPFDIGPTLSFGLRAFWVNLALLWLLLQIYSFALLLEQEDQRLRVALRNAAVLFATNPGFTIVLAVLLLILAAVASLVFPPVWFLILLALFAVVCNEAVRYLLEPYREQAQMRSEEQGA